MEGTPSIARRLKKNGIVDDRSARLMTEGCQGSWYFEGFSKRFRVTVVKTFLYHPTGCRQQLLCTSHANDGGCAAVTGTD